MKDDLLGNKIFGAVTGTLLLLFGLRQVSDMVFATHLPMKPGYHIAVQEAASDAAPVADTPPDWGTVLPTADVAAGATIVGKCKSCHNFDNGGPNQTGPNLWGVIGRKPGSHPGFAYSAAMTGFGAKQPVWDFQHVYEFIAGPQAYLDGTKMSFVGLKDRQDRINVIAWLRTQSSNPAPIPPADPKAAAAAKAPADAASGTAPAPAPNTVAATPASAGAGSKPVSVNGAAPSSDQTASPTGATPNAGAAAAPTRITEAPTASPPK
jgi:cytochrome c